jgi:hypothetical protein
MIKKSALMASLMSMILGNAALAYINITFKGTEGTINEQALQDANKVIARFIEVGAVGKYTMTSIDASGSVGVCVEFIGCTSPDQHYLGLLTQRLSHLGTDMPVFEIKNQTCR